MEPSYIECRWEDDGKKNYQEQAQDTFQRGRFTENSTFKKIDYRRAQ